MRRRFIIKQSMFMSLELSKTFLTDLITGLCWRPLSLMQPSFFITFLMNTTSPLAFWPTVLHHSIFFNYNLPPDICFWKKYCIYVGTVPKKTWDWDLYCWQLVQELIKLDIGVKAFDAISKTNFSFHAYLVLAFGDIPAMALIMHMKGQNGISPCWICEIKGICFEYRTHYVPLWRDKIPGANPPQYDPSHLYICTNEKLLEQASEVEMAPNNVTREQLAKKYGIKGIPVLSSLF